MPVSITLLRVVHYLVGLLISFPPTPNFGERVDLGLVRNEFLKEASGIVASRMNPDVLWTHNDSGDKNRIYALGLNGKHLGTFSVQGASARDWEDIAVGPGPVEGKQYLYIGDIGDNNSAFELKYIYRVPEPELKLGPNPIDGQIIGGERIAFQYPDGMRDAETLLVDPLSKDLYVISKRESSVRVYRAAYPQSTQAPITLEHVINLNLNNVVAGDISPSGEEVILKTYGAIFYWRKSSNKDCWEVFGNKPIKLPYIPEPQGEAICWRSDAMGYYTVSEERGGIESHLYFYPRLRD